MSSGNQVLTSSGSLLSLCIVQVICIVLIPLVITKDIQQDYSNVTAKESVITADNEIYTNNSSDYTVYNTSGLITWHDDSFPTSSHHIEPADPCKAEAYFGDIALTKDEALSIKGAVFREDILNKKKKVSKPPSATHETSYVNGPDLGRPVGEHGIFDFDAIQEYQHKKLQEKLYNQKKYIVTSKLLADNESNSTQLVKALHGNVRKRGQHARKHRNNKRKSKNKPSRHAKGGQNKPSRHGQGTQHRSRSKSKKKRGQERGHRGNKRNRQQLREGFNLRQDRNDTITKSNAKRNNTMDSKRDGETKRSRKHGRSNRKRMQLHRTDTSVVGTTRSGLRRETRSRGQRSRRAATAKLDRLWDNAVIPYEVEANFSGSHKALFKQAMRHWENLTCISFVERSKEDRNYIVFTERPCGCCSFVGRRGNGPQAISIGKNCDKFGIVVHELGHVIGFWHEHTRPDRDNHVDIIYKNIMPGQEYNFNKLTSNEVNSLNEPYDYESIMHYSRNTFSRWSTTYTIEPLVETEPDIHIGQRVKLSPGDIRQANKLYKCPSCGRTLQDSMGTFGSPPTRSTTTPQPLNPHQNQTPTKGQTHDNYIDNTPDVYTPPELENEFTYEIEGVDMVSSITEDNDLELEQERMIQDQPQADVLVPALPAKNMMSDAEANPILCEWRISGTHGEKIVLNITMLDLPQSHGCISDYLEIRDGHWLQSQLIGRYCEADNVPDTLVSTDSRMWIQYYSVTPGNHLGFLATYEAVCGGEILRDHGILSSPNYPDYYKPNKECVWKIGVEEHYRVALMFQSFEVENHDKCVYDYLEIRDGNDDSSPLVNKYCGYKMPPHVRSTNNRLYVKFKSDSSVQKAGFHARFIKEFDECSTNKHGCHHICVNTMGSFRCQCRIGYELHSDGKRCEDACGGYKRNNNGTVHSPSFPDPYPANKNCEWRIVAPDNYRITINFTNFELEGNNQDCEYDSVDIRSGDNKSDTLHGVFCGSELPETITSDSNIMRITFSTDNNIQKSGFSAHYFIDMDECADDNGGCQHICRNTIGAYECACHNGFTLHDNNHDCKEGGCQHDISLPVGEISSPGWPAFYPSRKHCIWRFHTTQGHRIKLEFSNFELEPHQECSYDRLEVFDSNREDVSHRIDKFCGAKEPSIIISSGNQLYITFYSDASVQRQGFHATHTTVCGGRMTATNSAKFLFSHAKYGDQNYDNKESCDWLLVAEDSNYQIRFRFLAFEVEDETDCSYDYVEVYDGNDLTAPRINRYCGNTIPPEISSSGIYLLIRFKTDDTINWKGFSGAFVLRAATTPQHEISSTTNTQTHYDRVRTTQVKKITSQRYKKQLPNNNRE